MKIHKEISQGRTNEESQGTTTRKIMKNHQDAQKAPGKDNKITTWMFPVKNDNKEEDKERTTAEKY